MKSVILTIILSIIFQLQIGQARAQTIERPDPSVIQEAKSIVADSIFARLKAGQSESLAEWVTDQVHTEASGNSRMQQLNEFRSSFDMIAQGPPESPFGEMVGFDLLQESALPGTDKYFRLTYMTYHQEVPLVWEVHFYVKPDGNPSLTMIRFDGQNPFSYMTTPDMLIERYYDSY